MDVKIFPLTKYQAGKALERLCPICGGELVDFRLDAPDSYICEVCARIYFVGPAIP